MKILLIFFLVLVTGVFVGNCVVAQQTLAPENVKQQDNATGYTEIARIFDQRCVSCHSGARPPEKLRLDNYKNIMTGSKDGPVVVPGKPSESKLLKAVRGEIKPRMPKNGPPWLTDSQMALIEQWISAGSPDAGVQ
jgi:mono/diheme cytochrome c family protein